MSDAYERERQNNSRLSELSAKVTALRGVTVDIYDNARSQDVIDNTVCVWSSAKFYLIGGGVKLVLPLFGSSRWIRNREDGNERSTCVDKC